MTTRFRTSILALAALAAGLLFAAEVASAQDLHSSRRLSPVGIAKTFIGDTYVKVTYGRPYVRGRVIFGEPTDSTSPLVPYGQIWRTGANEATELTTTGPLRVAGERLPAGTYSIFTVPGPESWEVRFSPLLGLDGTGRISPDGQFTPNVYDPDQDVLAVEASSSQLEDDVSQLTIAFEPSDAGAHMVLRWETTEVRIPLATP